MVCNRCHSYFSFWDIFCPSFTSVTAQKIKIKKRKKYLEISSFYIKVPKIMIISYTVPEIWHVTDIIIFHFGLIFSPFSPLTVQKIKIKKKKNTWRSHHFLYVFQNYDQMMYGSWDMVCDRRMDRQTEKRTYRGGSPT